MKIRSGKDKAWYGIHPTHQAGRSPAYVVAIKRQGIQVRKHFTLAHFESPEAALRAAQDWRDRVLALLPPMTRRELRTLVRRNNTSGVPGVFRFESPEGAYWIASGEADGKKTARKFNIGKYGEDKARRLAVEARRRMLAAVDGPFWVATEAALALARQHFGDPDAVAAPDAVVWDASARERFLARLEAEGLVVKPEPAPPVNRREFPSCQGPVWEATYKRTDGRTTVRRFSVRKYGEAAAERLAREAYARLEAEFGKK